jgi:hypothetical protein
MLSDSKKRVGLSLAFLSTDLRWYNLLEAHSSEPSQETWMFNVLSGNLSPSKLVLKKCAADVESVTVLCHVKQRFRTLSKMMFLNTKNSIA